MENQDLSSVIQEGNVGQDLKYHTHNGVDSPVIDTTPFIPVNLAAQTGIVPVANGGTGLATLTAYNILAGNGTSNPTFIAPGTSGQLLTSGGASSNPSFQTYTPPTPSYIAVDIPAGEQLTAGEAVFLQKGGGYGSNASIVYAMRTAGNTTTYSPNFAGLANDNINYLSTGSILVSGKSTYLSGLTEATTYYLKNYGASSKTIDQTHNSKYVRMGISNPIIQMFIPTSSLLDSLVVAGPSYISGSTGTITVTVKRANTTLATGTYGGGDITVDLTGIRSYKGEILTFTISIDGDKVFAFPYDTGYYAPTYTGPGGGTAYASGGGVTTAGAGTISSSGTAVTGSGTSFTTVLMVGSTITAGGQSKIVASITDDTNLATTVAFSPALTNEAFVWANILTTDDDMTFSLNEIGGFGLLDSSAGTRKIKAGLSVTATDLILQPQFENTIL